MILPRRHTLATFGGPILLTVLYDFPTRSSSPLYTPNHHHQGSAWQLYSSYCQVAENAALMLRVQSGYIEPLGPTRFECDSYRCLGPHILGG